MAAAAVVLLSCCSYQTASRARNNCCCCCAYKDTAPAGRGNTMALKDERGPKYTFSGAGTSLLKSPRKSLLLNSKACYCYCYYCYCYIYIYIHNYVQLRTIRYNYVPGRQIHGPAGRGNSMALKDERGPKYAFSGAGTSLLKSPRKKSLLKLTNACYLLDTC